MKKTHLIILLTLALGMLLPSPVQARPSSAIERGGEIVGGPILEVALTQLGDTDRLVTAVRLTDDRLKLIAWEVRDDHSLVRLGDITGGEIERVAITSLTANRVVTAIQRADGHLRLIVWRVEDNGEFTRLGDATAGEVKRVAIARVAHNRVVTAVRVSDDRLVLSTWDVNAAGDISRQDSHTAGEVQAVEVAALTPWRVITATPLLSDAKVKVILWEITSAGQITRKADALSSSAYTAAIDVKSPTQWQTYSDQSPFGIKAANWTLSSDGEITSQSDIVSTSGDQIDALGGITIARTGSGNLRIAEWDTFHPLSDWRAADPPKIIDEASAGTIERLALARVSSLYYGGNSGVKRFVTAVRLKDGDNLKLIVWYKYISF